MAKLSETAMLMSLSISVWAGNRMDKTESDDVTARHGATRRSARVHKSLLPNCNELEAVKKYAAAMRIWFYKNTLPWIAGQQIMRADAYMQFMADYRKRKTEFERLVRDFLDVYDDARRKARVSLNTMYNETEYPSAADLERRFAVDLKAFPVPEQDDWRVQLHGEDMARLKAELQAAHDTAIAEAMDTAYARLHDVCQKMHDRLKDPDAIFRNSLVSNVRDMCKALGKLNVSNDPRLEKMRREVEKQLGRQDPEALRKDPASRKDAAAAAKRVMDKMAAIYGPMAA